MKQSWIAGLVMAIGMAAGSAQAADEEAGKTLTAEQQQQRSALIQKYDVNKDGLLDQKETKTMSKADKKALAKLGGVGTAKKTAKTEKIKAEEKTKDAKDAQKATEAKADKAAKEVEKKAPDAAKADNGKGKK